MKVIRDIAFSRTEPPKSFVWVGFTDEGKYFIRIWNNGWKDVGGTGSYFTIDPGNGLTVSQEGDNITIGIEQELYDTIVNVTSEISDWVIGTAEDVDEICN